MFITLCLLFLYSNTELQNRQDFRHHKAFLLVFSIPPTISHHDIKQECYIQFGDFQLLGTKVLTLNTRNKRTKETLTLTSLGSSLLIQIPNKNEVYNFKKMHFLTFFILILQITEPNATWTSCSTRTLFCIYNSIVIFPS